MSGCCKPFALLGTYVRSRRSAAHDFGDLTSGTIFYEDVAESDAANNRATLNKDMLDAIIARSVLNGIIGETKTVTPNTSLITNSPNTVIK